MIFVVLTHPSHPIIPRFLPSYTDVAALLCSPAHPEPTGGSQNHNHGAARPAQLPRGAARVVGMGFQPLGAAGLRGIRSG